MDVEKLEAGPEADEIVCEAVGIRPKLLYAATAAADTNASWFTSHDKSEVEREINRIKNLYPDGWAAGSVCRQIKIYPRVTEEIESAWPLAERFGLSIIFSADGYYAINPIDIWHERVHCTDKNSIRLIGSDGEIFMPSETAPLAICKTALKSQAARASSGQEEK